ncbi:hypothetical protein MA16_Dca019471 [Dendrobium catenatum]|uniref:Uncharacterized protein n=1 Tax=Dendrobium catenatum TaxID=906689 RepID=A0A2I0WHJ2_9ASPA|nr:hypothetical protein MA16_Dca019471 [Dendrobium catenatum]
MFANKGGARDGKALSGPGVELSSVQRREGRRSSSKELSLSLYLSGSGGLRGRARDAIRMGFGIGYGFCRARRTEEGVSTDLNGRGRARLGLCVWNPTKTACLYILLTTPMKAR